MFGNIRDDCHSLQQNKNKIIEVVVIKLHRLQQQHFDNCNTNLFSKSLILQKTCSLYNNNIKHLRKQHQHQQRRLQDVIPWGPVLNLASFSERTTRAGWDRESSADLWSRPETGRAKRGELGEGFCNAEK